MFVRVLQSSWTVVVLTVIAASAILLHGGIAFTDIVLIALYVVFFIGLPGVFTWRWLLQGLHRRQNPPTWFEDLSLGTIFGFGLQLPVYLVGLIIGFPWLVGALPIAVVVAACFPFGRRVTQLPNSRLDWRASWGLGAVVGYGMVFLSQRAFVLRPMSDPPFKTRSIDETFHQALIGELSHRFPPKIPFVDGVGLDYHWFVHAQMATMKWITGVDAVPLLRQLMPMVIMLLLVPGLGAVALRLTRRPSVAVVAPALLLAGAFHLFGQYYEVRQFIEPFMSERFVSSLSQSYGALLALPLLMLMFEVLRPKVAATRGTWVALVIALFALSGAKATFLPVFLCGGIAVVVLRLFMTRRFDRTSLALTAWLFVATVFAQRVLFGGQSGAMLWAPMESPSRMLTPTDVPDTAFMTVVLAIAMLIAWLLYGVGAVGLARAGRWKDPRVLLAIGAIPAGIAIPFLFFRPGLSQFWFQRSTAELIVLMSVWGLAYLLPRPLTRAVALRLLGLALVVGLTAYLVMIGITAVTDEPRQITTASLVFTVATPLLIAVGFGIAREVQRRRGRRPMTLVVLVTMLLGLGLVNVFATVGYAIRSDPLRETTVEMFPEGGYEAGVYVRDHSDPDDVIATNMHCAEPQRVPADPLCDNRNFWLSGYSERRVLIEGWGYNSDTATEGTLDTPNRRIDPPDPRLLLTNDAFFLYPSEATLQPLVEHYGVDWIVVGKHWPVDLEAMKTVPGIELRHESANYAVFEVTA